MIVIEGDYDGPLPAYWTGNQFVPVPHSPGPGHVWQWAPVFAWDFQQAEATNQLHAAKAAALGAIDTEAGRARLRYITSVPGQAETYQRKEQQARAWAETGFTGPAPSFIAAEADALGRSARAVAEEVIGLADLWADVTGPAIEACRRKWKVAAESATTLEQIDQIRASAKAELAAL